MKIIYLILMGVSISFFVNAQNYSDDFESYIVGDYIGVESDTWSTWSGTTGGNEDAQINNNEAHSGSNSLYFEVGSDGSGPQDVVLDFGGLQTEDIFKFEAYFYIPDGNAAYFNFQGDEVIGTTWAIDVYMNSDGTLAVSQGGVNKVYTTYESDTWFKVEFDINLTLNVWEFLVDDVSEGTWVNGVNQVSMADFFPATDDDLWYMDDVAYSVEEYVLPNLNLSATEVSFDAIGVAGQEKSPTVTIQNAGVTEVTSFDLDITYNGTSEQINFDAVSIASIDYYIVELSSVITLIEGENDVVATISNVNGLGVDDNPDDDSATKTLDPGVPSPHRVVIAEEGTGTWCGWCPRGAVAMDFMADKYDGYYHGIAVHNGVNDPMVNENYDDGLGFSSFPGAMVDRGAVIDPAGIEIDFISRIEEVANASIMTGAMWDDNTLMVSLTYSTLEDFSGNWRVACVLTEDGVSGTIPGYAQVNYYSGGTTMMGGYENLADPVPASDMVYDHVARAISPTVSGLADAFPSGAVSGTDYTFNFTFTIPSDWDADNMHIVGMLLDTEGEINNGGGASIADAVANGYTEGQDVVGVKELSNIVSKYELYPNPTTNLANIDIELKSARDVSLQIVDISGKTVKTINFGQLNGSYTLPIGLSELKAGVYFVNLVIGDRIITEKLLVN